MDLLEERKDVPSLLIKGILDGHRRELRLEPESIRRFRNDAFKRGIAVQEALRHFPEDRARELVARFELERLELITRQDSERDGASKFLFANRDGLRFETVLMRIKSGRNSVCVSSQVGCAVGCRFCATAQSGTGRNLDSADILGQILKVQQFLAQSGARLRNVVFMGMGEPLLNWDHVCEAVEHLLDPQVFALSGRHVLVSTVGIVDKMPRLVERFPTIGLALSLHSAQQSTRERLIPLAQRVSMQALRDAVWQCNQQQSRPVMLEYLLLRDVNDSEEEMRALLTFCAGLHVHVNLIPYNPVPGLAFATSETTTRDRFREQLRAAGVPVTVRHSLGADIDAACGQLLRSENRKLIELARVARPQHPTTVRAGE